MSDQLFSIQKKVFEVEANSTQHVHELQNRISHLVNFTLLKKMEDYFSKVIPENLVLRMDQLILNIGEVSWDSMEEEIAQRFMQNLEDEFSLRLHLLKDVHNASLSGITIETIGTGKQELFEYFLVNGVLPWYADSARDLDIDQLVDMLYGSWQPQLKEIIRRVGKQENVRKRISYQFSEDSIRRILQTLEPAEAQYMIQSHQDISKLQKEKQVVQTETREFDKSLWLFILNYLLVEMSSEFSKKMFVRSNLSQIAANYNISYHDLLHIFYDALEAVHAVEVFVPLQSVIYELFSEDTEFVPVKKIAVKRAPEQVLQMDTLFERVELLKYYVRFGTIPLAWQTISKADLAEIFLQVARATPLTLKDILLHAGTGSAGPGSLYAVLGPAGTRDLVKLVFAEKERELGNIVATFAALQDKQPFINEASAIFSAELWNYVLDSLLFSAPSGSDDKALIRSILQRISAAYDVLPGSVLKALHETLQQSAQQPGAYAPVFSDIKEVVGGALQNNGEPTIEFTAERKSWYEKEQEEQVHRTATLHDLLRYIIQYGSIPWWGRRYYSLTTAEMISKVHSSNRAVMILIMRRAALDPQMKARLLSNISFAQARELLTGLPNGAAATLAMDDLLVLLNASKFLQYYEEVYVQMTVFSIALDVMSQAGYALFSRAAFYLETIIVLSGILDMDIALFIAGLSGAIEKIPDSAIANKLRIILRVVQDHFSGPLTKENKAATELTYEIIPGTELPPLLQKYFPVDETTAPQLLPGISGTLQYFLQWNRLPDDFVNTDEQERVSLLREILMTLFRFNRTALGTLLKDETNTIASQLSLSELFAESEGGTEKALAYFLSVHELPALKTIALAERPFADLREPTGRKQVPDLAAVFSNKNIIAEKRSDAYIFTAAQQTFEHFLRNNQLPPDIDVEGREKTDLLLITLLELLFVRDPGSLRRQFQSPGISIEAKLRVYDILAVQPAGIADQLSRFLDESREKDIIRLLSQQQHGQDAVNREELGSLIMNVLQQSTPEAIKAKPDEVFSSPAFAAMVLERFGFPLFLQIAAGKTAWSLVPESIIAGWLNIIRDAIPGGLEKEKLMDLFRRFNIELMAGRSNIKTDDAYTIALLKYLFADTAIDITTYKNLFENAASARPVMPGMETQQKLIRQVLKPLILQKEQSNTVEQDIGKQQQLQLALDLKEELNGYRERQLDVLKKETSETRIKKQNAEQEIYDKFGEDDSESIYIGNAGLILFHPFLETYFSRVGLMQKRVFNDLAARNRAVLLLQYMANGESQSAEHELVLNKILCNVPVAEAVPVSLILTEEEISVSAELYGVFIERWSKMKNSTVNGLRVSFIMRGGMLKLIDGNWNLKVEQKGYDLLLQTYPWAFGYIKTPWMNNTLIVEWM